MDEREQWIFFLKLGRELPKDFFALDQQFKANGKTLIPVGLKTMSSLLSEREDVHILIVVKSVQEYIYFHKRVKKVMKYMVRSGKVYLYIASSFNKMIDSEIMRRNHYNFLKLPVTINYLCGSISKTIDMKNSGQSLWPGGGKSKFQLAI